MKIFFHFNFDMADITESKYFTTTRITRSKLSSNETGQVKTPSSDKSETCSKLKRKLKIEKIDIKYEDVKNEIIDSVDIKKEKWEPNCWKEQLKNMFEMRKNRDAPVDSMGCDVISDVSAKPEVHI